MYGTIARLQIKPDAVEALKEFSRTAQRPDGAVAEYVYQMDDNPGELFVVVMFEDRESYVGNSQSPEQHEK